MGGIGTIDFRDTRQVDIPRHSALATLRYSILARKMPTDYWRKSCERDHFKTAFRLRSASLRSCKILRLKIHVIVLADLSLWATKTLI